MKHNTLTLVKDLFTKYLENNKYRKTPERFAILEAIYTHPEHFDVEKLYYIMKQQNYRVSRATIYNTMDLLVDANLLIKHKFDNHVTEFEPVVNFKQHDHLICLKCGQITEFSNHLIDEMKFKIECDTDFQIHSHVLYFHGICSQCNTKKNNSNDEN